MLITDRIRFHHRQQKMNLPRLPSAVGMLRTSLLACVFQVSTTEALSLNQHVQKAAYGQEFAQTSSLQDLMTP